MTTEGRPGVRTDEYLEPLEDAAGSESNVTLTVARGLSSSPFVSGTVTAERTILTDLCTRLPNGYRARAFEDADREAIVTAGSAERHPMEAESAEQWRRRESLVSDPRRLRLAVVTTDGAIVGTGVIEAGTMPSPHGSQAIGISVNREHRNKGIGGALLAAFEAEARRRDLVRILAGASLAMPFALEFAEKRGYREVGRLIISYLDLGSYEPADWRRVLERPASAGVRSCSFSEILGQRDAAGKERFWRELWEAEAPMWDDIPFATPTPHWPFERFYSRVVKSGRLSTGLSLVAYEGERIVGFAQTAERQGTDGLNWMTGVARTHRGQGIAMALKADVCARAKARGLRAMCAVNDEQNRAMRELNLRLGYRPTPDRLELEKRL